MGYETIVCCLFHSNHRPEVCNQGTMTSEERASEVAEIIAEAAKLPLKDAAFSLWRQHLRLDTLEGRPTDEQVRIYRAMSPAQQSAKYRHERDHAEDGPSFTHLKRAHPRASDTEIKLAIMAAVKFDDACAKYFSTDYRIDFWQRCVDAVARAEKENPGFLESTYQYARNQVAYDNK
jgi:hypothetical protein